MKLFSEKHTPPDGIDISFQARAAENVESSSPGVIPGKVGQRRSLAESHPIPGNSREDSGEERNPRVLVLYQEEWGSVDPSGESSDSREFQVV